MVVMLLPVAAGLVGGRLFGGRLRGLGALRLRATGLVVLAVAVQASLHRAPADARLPLVLLTYAAAGAWLRLNIKGRRGGTRLGLVLIAGGWALNLAAIVPNGGMPVSIDGLEQVGAPAGFEVDQGHLWKHVEADGGPGIAAGMAAWLGDAIPVAPLRAVISVGDIAMAAGIAVLIAAAMRGAGLRRSGLRRSGGRRPDEAPPVGRPAAALCGLQP